MLQLGPTCLDVPFKRKKIKSLLILKKISLSRQEYMEVHTTATFSVQDLMLFQMARAFSDYVICKCVCVGNFLCKNEGY